MQAETEPFAYDVLTHRLCRRTSDELSVETALESLQWTFLNSAGGLQPLATLRNIDTYRGDQNFPDIAASRLYRYCEAKRASCRGTLYRGR